MKGEAVRELEAGDGVENWNECRVRWRTRAVRDPGVVAAADFEIDAEAGRAVMGLDGMVWRAGVDAGATMADAARP